MCAFSKGFPRKTEKALLAGLAVVVRQSIFVTHLKQPAATILYVVWHGVENWCSSFGENFCWWTVIAAFSGCALDWLERLELSNELCGPRLLKNGGFFLQLECVCVCVCLTSPSRKL